MFFFDNLYRKLSWSWSGVTLRHILPIVVLRRLLILGLLLHSRNVSPHHLHSVQMWLLDSAFVTMCLRHDVDTDSWMCHRGWVVFIPFGWWMGIWRRWSGWWWCIEKSMKIRLICVTRVPITQHRNMSILHANHCIRLTSNFNAHLIIYQFLYCIFVISKTER